MANVKKNVVASVPEVEEVKKNTGEEFLKKNRNAIIIVVSAVIVLFALNLAYTKYIYEPKCEEAMQQMFPAENLFQQGQFETALKGDGTNPGFEQVIADYGKKAGKAVYLYAGICELKLGNCESALEYLKKYNGKDEILAARALACQGDAYVGLEDYENALKMFRKAAAKADNVFAATYLIKAGVVCEKLGDRQGALDCYKEVKDKYPQSIEGYEVDSYINGVEVE